MRGCQYKVGRDQRAGTKARAVDVKPSYRLPGASILGRVEPVQGRILGRGGQRQ